MNDRYLNSESGKKESLCNKRDHLIVGVYYESKQRNTLDNAENISNLLQYLLFKKGAFTSNVAEAGGFVKIQPESKQPDLQLYFAPAYFIKHGFMIIQILMGYLMLALAMQEPLKI